MPTPAFQAYAKGAYVNAETARDAAEKFFAAFPSRRKCNILAGELDGHFFTIHFSWSKNGRPFSRRNVTKSQVNEL